MPILFGSFKIPFQYTINWRAFGITIAYCVAVRNTSISIGVLLTRSHHKNVFVSNKLNANKNRLVTNNE